MYSVVKNDGMVHHKDPQQPLTVRDHGLQGVEDLIGLLVLNIFHRLDFSVGPLTVIQVS